jgi:mycothiol synthase
MNPERVGSVAVRVDPAAFDWSSETGPAADVRRVVAAAVASDGRGPLNEASLLSLRHHGLGGAALFLARAEESDPSAAGFAVVHTAAGTQEPGDLNLVVAPDCRRRGVGTALGRAVLAADGATTALNAWSHGNHPGASVLADRLGFARVRDLWVMRRSLREPLPSLEPPPGVELRTFRPEDSAAFLDLNARAFAHHPEQGGMTRADLDERAAEAWFDPAGFFLAVDGAGTLLGFLYVEADNAPAVHVYERLGFTHAAADTDVMYQRPAGP